MPKFAGVVCPLMFTIVITIQVPTPARKTAPVTESFHVALRVVGIVRLMLGYVQMSVIVREPIDMYLVRLPQIHSAIRLDKRLLAQPVLLILVKMD